MEKLTKIVATISDKRCDPEFLKQLHEAGMDVVRINTAHQTPEQALGLIENVRKVSGRIPLMLDTKGPEIRTNASPHELVVLKDQLIMVKGKKGIPSDDQCLCLDFEGIVNHLHVGNRLMIDDGEIELQVIEKHDEHLICRVGNPGIIKGRKSVNLPGITIDLPSLTKKDIEFIEFGIKNNLDFIAHSFVRTKQDVIDIQKILDKHNSPIKIIAKIENQQGVDNIDEILEHVYGIMVARGDLAIEVPAERIPVIQARLIKKCIRQKKAVIIATQMLHSMITSPRPTRAEVSDIATAIFSGTDAVMLSGETAYGKYPLESVQIMTRTAHETERNKPFLMDSKVMPHDNDISVFLSKTAVRSIQKLNTKAIITDTDTGKTARYLSAFRGKTPIYAQCYDHRVVRELALNYGVYADFLDVETSKKEFSKATLTRLINKDEISPEDLIVVMAGNFGKKSGPSYVEISTAQNMLSEVRP
ncbi:MAG: pyruvate kinase [Bacteroidales bacterium]|jgi:pyruvate kinase|nr:pyruvate kinase [Bacteroidales bacterium]